jgi:hypothetical protein
MVDAPRAVLGVVTTQQSAQRRKVQFLSSGQASSTPSPAVEGICESASSPVRAAYHSHWRACSKHSAMVVDMTQSPAFPLDIVRVHYRHVAKSLTFGKTYAGAEDQSQADTAEVARSCGLSTRQH